MRLREIILTAFAGVVLLGCSSVSPKKDTAPQKKDITPQKYDSPKEILSEAEWAGLYQEYHNDAVKYARQRNWDDARVCDVVALMIGRNMLGMPEEILRRDSREVFNYSP